MTLQHIIADPDILMNEVEAYSNLPDDLKDEIRKLLSSFNPQLALRHSTTGPPLKDSPPLKDMLVRSKKYTMIIMALNPFFLPSLPLSPLPFQHSEIQLVENAAYGRCSGSNATSGSGNITSSTRQSHSSSSSDGEEEGEEEAAAYAEIMAFQEALRTLRNFVGEEPSDDTLRDMLLAADMDVNRAVNFFLDA